MKVGPNYTIAPLSSLNKLEGKDLEQYEAMFGRTWHESTDVAQGIPDTHPSKRRADIVVGGQWVATVYEKGGVNVADRYRSAVLAMNNDYLTADQIARKIASAVGGVVTAPRDRD